MGTAAGYPKRYRRNIREIMNRLCVNADTAYQMMLMTATLMDMGPEDPTVLEMILLDCGIED